MTDQYNHGKCPRCRRPVWGDPDLECSHCGWREHDYPVCACGEEIQQPDDGVEIDGVWTCNVCVEDRKEKDDEAQRDEEADRKYEDLKCGP